ncbi:zinc finger protein ZAT5-like [Bidens hawaiensis]|uniref:zinc finger protein ZAT5-like n=1 Tax=Bidens hawaiensis TaxID=980011 RepID=UPI0040499DC9
MKATQEYYYSSIIKGKYTKLQRASSPLALTMASNSSTTTTSTNEDGDHTNNPLKNTFHMPTGSIEFTKLVQENEEEDMANCLILPAQGHSSPPPSPHKADTVEVARTPGFYVYECKTCYRGFSSFQALGGHRASHKKTHDNLMKLGVDNHQNSTALSLKIGSNQMRDCNPSGSIKVTKIHMCSICSAEFGSGQAPGGHMRRHRSMPMGTTTSGDSGWFQESKKPRNLLSLDLNLPAPIEDDHNDTKFPFRPRDQMIAFSNSSLVHCPF